MNQSEAIAVLDTAPLETLYSTAELHAIRTVCPVRFHDHLMGCSTGIPDQPLYWPEAGVILKASEWAELAAPQLDLGVLADAASDILAALDQPCGGVDDGRSVVCSGWATFMAAGLTPEQAARFLAGNGSWRTMLANVWAVVFQGGSTSITDVTTYLTMDTMLRGGATVAAVRADTGLDRTTIHRYAKRIGVTPPLPVAPVRTDDELVEAMRQLVNQGRTVTEAYRQATAMRPTTLSFSTARRRFHEAATRERVSA